MKPSKKQFVAIFILALAVRLILFATLADKYGTFDFTLGPQDTQGFINDARNLYSGHGFSDVASPPYTPDGVRVPVVALILGLFGSRVGWYVVLQIFVASVACVLLADLGTRFFGKTIGLTAGAILALDPLTVFHSQIILSETWFASFLVLAVWLFAKFWENGPRFLLWLVASAICLGLATLTRPVGATIFAVFLFALLFLSRGGWFERLKQVALFAFVVLLVVSPWLVRNQRTFGTWGLSYIPAYNWYHFNARVFYSSTQGISKDEAKQLFYQRAEAERQRRGSANEFEMQDFYFRESSEIITAAPVKYMLFHGLNTAAVLFTGSLDDLRKVFDKNYHDINITSQILLGKQGIWDLARNEPLVLAEKIFLLLCYLVILCGFLVSIRQLEVLKKSIFLGLLAFTLAATTGAVAEGRFRVPAEPFLILLFVWAFFAVWKTIFPRFYENSIVRRDISA